MSVGNVNVISQAAQQKSKQMQIDTSSCLSPSSLCLSPASRLERLRKLQSRMIPDTREEHQFALMTTSAELLAEEERKLPMTRRILSGARQRASKSLRRQNGKLTGSSSRPDPKSSLCTSHGGIRNDQTQGLGAEAFQEKAKKNYGERISRDLQSISSSTDRSKELLHSMSTTARSRNAAAAKPGR